MPAARVINLFVFGVSVLSIVANDVDDLAFDDECLSTDSECSLHALQARSRSINGTDASSSADETKAATEDAPKRVCPPSLAAGKGSNCYNLIQWIKTKGLQENPDWFPNLTSDSSDALFQSALAGVNKGDCIEPCPRPLKYCSKAKLAAKKKKKAAAAATKAAAAKADTPEATGDSDEEMDDFPIGSLDGGDTDEDDSTDAPDTACLCVFDVDRTLTGAQGAVDKCPGDTLLKGIPDQAYFGGNLTASDLGSQSMQKTRCGNCYKSIVTAGNVSGEWSKERLYLQYHMLADFPGSPQMKLLQKLGWGAETIPWTKGDPAIESVSSPFVELQQDGTKQYAVDAVVGWYQQQGVKIGCEKVYFFDDRYTNIAPFQETPFNAKQISCATRDPVISGVGLCGATINEINSPTTGTNLCMNLAVP